jgi:hypothetical protein
MRTNSLSVAALPLLLCVGCATERSAELTPQQVDQIKSEVKAVGDSVIARFERLDAKGTAQLYANSPDWVMYNADGSQWDYPTTTKNMLAMMDPATGPITGWKWTTISQHFVVVNKDLVILAWVGRDETTMRTGEVVVYDPHAYTWVLRRIDGQWKVVWSQDSGTPVTHKAAAAKRAPK